MINIYLNPPSDGQLAMFFNGDGKFVCAGTVNYAGRVVSCMLISPVICADVNVAIGFLDGKESVWGEKITHWQEIKEG